MKKSKSKSKAMPPLPPLVKNGYVCSFCGKSDSEVRIIAGPMVYICNECVSLCNDIIKDDLAAGRTTGSEDTTKHTPGNVCSNGDPEALKKLEAERAGKLAAEKKRAEDEAARKAREHREKGELRDILVATLADAIDVRFLADDAHNLIDGSKLPEAKAVIAKIAGHSHATFRRFEPIKNMELLRVELYAWQIWMYGIGGILIGTLAYWATSLFVSKKPDDKDAPPPIGGAK